MHRKASVLIFMFIVLVSFPISSNAGVDFIMDIKPGAMVFSPDMDGFSLYQSSSGYYTYYYEEEHIEGVGSFAPQLDLGIGIATPAVYIDITGGIGIWVNGALISPNFATDLAFRFRLGRVVTLGPHVGALFFNPSWQGEMAGDDVELDADPGFVTGIVFTVGHPKVGFSLSLDYINAAFGVVETNGWTPSSYEINMSGFALRLGVFLRL